MISSLKFLMGNQTSGAANNSKYESKHTAFPILLVFLYAGVKTYCIKMTNFWYFTNVETSVGL